MTIQNIDVHDLASIILGTIIDPNTWLEEHGLCPIDNIEDQLLDCNVERCPICDWWVESSELVNVNDEECGCDNCKPKALV